MALAFIALFMFDVAVGVLLWFGWQRVTAHLRANPEAAKLVAEHVITPLLTGEQAKTEPVMKSSKGTLV